MKRSELYKRQGFGQSLLAGSRPALLIADFEARFADPDHFGRGNIAEAIRATILLLANARGQRWPIAYSKIVFAEDGCNGGVFAQKGPNFLKLTASSPLSGIVPELAPSAGELIGEKQGASSFFGKALSSWLTLNMIDTLVVTGGATSGCVRATAVDAMQHNFIPIAAVDCVGDRALAPHEADPFDMEQKYATIMTATQVMEQFNAA